MATGTGLVDVVVVRHAHDLAVLPNTDGSVGQLNLTAAADRTARLNEHAKAHSVAEVEGLLRLETVGLVGGPPVLDEATSCRPPFEDAHPDRGHVIRAIRRVEGHQCIQIEAIGGLGEFPLQPHEVGRRGLLGHGEQYPVGSRLRTARDCRDRSAALSGCRAPARRERLRTSSHFSP